MPQLARKPVKRTSDETTTSSTTTTSSSSAGLLEKLRGYVRVSKHAVHSQPEVGLLTPEPTYAKIHGLK